MHIRSRLHKRERESEAGKFASAEKFSNYFSTVLEEEISRSGRRMDRVKNEIKGKREGGSTWKRSSWPDNESSYSFSVSFAVDANEISIFSHHFSIPFQRVSTRSLGNVHPIPVPFHFRADLSLRSARVTRFLRAVETPVG